MAGFAGFELSVSRFEFMFILYNILIKTKTPHR